MTINQALNELLAATQRAHLEDAARPETTCTASIVWRCGCDAAKAYNRIKPLAHKLAIARVPGTRRRRTKAELLLTERQPNEHYPLKRNKPSNPSNQRNEE